jgi:2-polyprenyl-3-methyl-5-hydroxy-6-metoxy-1,4-benzoquinol methylase
MNYEIQTDIENYSSENYLTQNRWSSYNLIINEIIKLKPRTVLEIGPGNFIVSEILKRMNIKVKTLDFDAKLNPDFVCDISDYKTFPNEKFDCIIASQVFEHIKYEDFISTLKNLKENTDNIILSLPYTSQNSIFFHLHFFLPVIKQIRFSLKIYCKKVKHQFNGQHYWEIGKKFFSLRKIKKDIKNSGWKIMQNYINQQNPYHYFFILK